MTARRCVAVTGVGMVTPLGSSPAEVLRRIRAGDRVASPPNDFRGVTSPCPLSSEVRDFQLPEGAADPKSLRLMSRDAQFALSAGLAALKDAALVPGHTYPAEQVALFGATGLAGIGLEEVEPLIRHSAAEDGSFDAVRFGAVALARVRPILSFKILSNMPICFVSISTGIRGPSAVYNPWESQGCQALIRGIRAVETGEASCALVGGTDIKTHGGALVSLAQAGAFGPREGGGGCCIPAEGAVFLVLEDERRARDRGVRRYARIRSWSLGAPDPAPPEEAVRGAIAPLMDMVIGRGVGLVSAGSAGAERAAWERSAVEARGRHVSGTLTPKASLGDLFAASAAMQVGAATLLAGEQEGPDSVVAHCFGHGGPPAAFLVERADLPSCRPSRASEAEPESRRPVVTGLGVNGPLGNSVDTFWANLLAGHSGIGPVTLFDASSFPVRIAGEVRDMERDRLEGDFPEAIGERDRKVWLGLAAARDAMWDAGLAEGGALAGAAVAVGVSLEVFFLEDLTPLAKEEDLGRAIARRILSGDDLGSRLPLQTPLDRLAQILGRHYGFGPMRITDCSACAAGAHAIGDALRLVREGRCDLVLAGAADSMVNPLGLGGFALLKALSEENDDPARACRPFDATRQGTVLGEGAAFLVVESLSHARARGARIYAELLGFGASLDAYRVSDPEPSGEGAALAMRRALAHAGVGPDGVDCVSAHGTGTPKNDPVETLALKRALGARAKEVPVHAVKSMTGHLIAASGAVEALAAVLTLSRGAVPPTINLRVPDPRCDLDHVTGGARPFSGRTVLSNSFGFGGQNASLLLGRYTA